MLAFVPQTVALLGIFVLVGWLVQFAVNFLWYAGYTALRRGQRLEIRFGSLARRATVCRTDAVQFADCRQSVIAFFLRLMTVHIQTARPSGGKNGFVVLVPPHASARPGGKSSSSRRRLPGASPKSGRGAARFCAMRSGRFSPAR
jgi:uncharacterized membrane protein YdbT with pleckstrin-like domain